MASSTSTSTASTSDGLAIAIRNLPKFVADANKAYDTFQQRIPEVVFTRMTTHAVLPTRGSLKSAGLDLSSAYPYVVKARGKELVKTDLKVSLPDGTYGRIAPRSGLAWKNAIDVGAGVIDGDYEGNIGIILFNHSDTDFKIAPGDRVAQLILEKYEHAEIREAVNMYVNRTASKDDSKTRGTQGFGSTGVSDNGGSSIGVVSTIPISNASSSISPATADANASAK
jgi:dUTP pyrophosphatase